MSEVKLEGEPGLWGPAEHHHSQIKEQLQELSQIMEDTDQRGVQQQFHTRIKERPELCTQQDKEQLQEFTFTPVCVKTEDDEDEEQLKGEDYRADSEEEQLKGGECGVDSEEEQLKGADTEEGQTTDQSEDWTPEQVSAESTSTITDPAVNTKPLKCPECEKRFRFNSALRKHVLVHTGEKPLKCPECGKGFKFISDLRKHVLIHSGQRPYTCSVCGKGFVDNSNFRRHMRIHTGEKPFSCPFCEKEFADPGNLKRHLRVHTGERPFSCSVCKKEFSFLASYNRHIKIHRKTQTV